MWNNAQWAHDESACTVQMLLRDGRCPSHQLLSARQQHIITSSLLLLLLQRGSIVCQALCKIHVNIQGLPIFLIAMQHCFASFATLPLIQSLRGVKPPSVTRVTTMSFRSAGLFTFEIVIDNLLRQALCACGIVLLLQLSWLTPMKSWKVVISLQYCEDI